MKMHYGIRFYYDGENLVFGETFCGLKSKNVLENFTTENEKNVTCKNCLNELEYLEYLEKEYEEYQDKLYQEFKKKLEG